MIELPDVKYISLQLSFFISIFIIFQTAWAENQTIDFRKVDWYAKRANAAYKDEKYIRQHFPNTVLVATTQAEVQYFLEVDSTSRVQIISVRGSNNLANAKEDADYIESKNPKLQIYVHRGFDRDSHEIYQALLPHLDKQYSTILTGHSLGAAISSLLMIYLHEDGFKIESSINFGQPKLTNKKGAKKYQFLPLTRVVDEDDLVPLVPPDDFIDAIHGGYEHFGAEIILLSGRYYVYESKHVARSMSDDSFWKNFGNESVSDHYMKNYLRNINPKLQSSARVPYVERKKYMVK